MSVSRAAIGLLPMSKAMMRTIEIRAQIRPYSTAVTPD